MLFLVFYIKRYKLKVCIIYPLFQKTHKIVLKVTWSHEIYYINCFYFSVG